MYPPVDGAGGEGEVVSWLDGSDATVAAGNAAPAGSVNPDDAGGIDAGAVLTGPPSRGGIANAVTAFVVGAVGVTVDGEAEAYCDGVAAIDATGVVAGEVLPGKG